MNSEEAKTPRDLFRHTGIGQFGPAYRIMLENDAHARGSVDRVLMERMIRLAPKTSLYLYEEYTPTKVLYEKGSRPELERCLEKPGTVEGGIQGIARFCADLGKDVSDDLDAMRIGGTEEEIIRRGSDWCTDVARVACALCQVAGIPARMVYLADISLAYSGHAIIEAHRRGKWGAVDATTDVIYLHPNGEPASVWELMNQPALVEAHRRNTGTIYTTPGQFRAAAVSNYFVWEQEKYDYTVSRMNEYCRSILEMSLRGWPGGLRWLHGEDKCLQK